MATRKPIVQHAAPKPMDRDTDYVFTLLRAWGSVHNVTKGEDGKHWREVDVAMARSKMTMIPKGKAGIAHVEDHCARLEAEGYYKPHPTLPGWGLIKLSM